MHGSSQSLAFIYTTNENGQDVQHRLLRTPVSLEIAHTGHKPMFLRLAHFRHKDSLGGVRVAPSRRPVRSCHVLPNHAVGFSRTP
ncbi:hypothetical protein VTH06DRAFT_2268 [Thermothelomyces fergusii]